MSKQRVAERVAHGGHDVPASDIERRFPRSLRNLLDVYNPIVDRCVCFLNTDEAPELVFEQRGAERRIIHPAYFRRKIAGAEI